MSQAVICPVCGGTGKVLGRVNPYSTAVPVETTCHGCGGRGWVEVRGDNPLANSPSYSGGTRISEEV